MHWPTVIVKMPVMRKTCTIGVASYMSLVEVSKQWWMMMDLPLLDHY